MPRIPANDASSSSGSNPSDTDDSTGSDQQSSPPPRRPTREELLTEGDDFNADNSSDTQSPPNDINSGRRNTDSGSGSSGVPDDINRTRRSAPEDSSQDAGGSNGSGRSEDQGEAEVTGETKSEAAARTAAEQELRDAVASKGTTGRRLLDRQVSRQAGVDRADTDVRVTEDSVEVSRTASGTERAQKRAEEQFAEDVQTSQFAQRRLREQVASNSEDFESSDIDVDAGDGTLTIALTEGGQAREAIETAAENSEYSEEELTADPSGDGSFSVSVKDEAIIERAARENADLSESDLRVVETEQPDFRGKGRSATTERTVELTDEARNQRIREEVASEQAGVDAEDVSLEFGEDGEVTGASVSENFDDGGRFLGIGGAEDDVEQVVQGIGDFTGGVGRGVGQVIGGTAQLGANVSGLTDRGDSGIYDTSADIGERIGSVVNPTQLFTAADEFGEFVGGAAGRSLSGDASGALEDSVDSSQRIGSAVVTDFQENPVRATGGLVGSIALTGGAFKAAQGTRAGPLARATLQPGEEAFAAATGVRASSVARSALGSARESATSALRGQRGLNLGGNRGQFNLDVDTSQSTKQIQRELTGDETASDFDKPVSELDVSESTRRQILENTARADSESDAIFNQEADVSLRAEEARALREMPPAEAFQSVRQFSDSFQRRIDRNRQETTASEAAESAETVTTSRALPVRNVITLGALSSTAAATSPNLVDGIESTESQPRTPEAGAETAGLADPALMDDASTLMAGEAEGAVDVGIETGVDIQSGVEVSSALSQQTATQTAVESEATTEAVTETDAFTRTAQDTVSETEQAFEFEAESGSGNEREDLDLSVGGDNDRGRRRRFGGDEQRFDFGDINLL